MSWVLSPPTHQALRLGKASAVEATKYSFCRPLNTLQNLIFHQPQVESPRSTLLRYGLPYKPYDFTKDQEHQVLDTGNDGNNFLLNLSGGLAEWGFRSHRLL